eukprot:gi/632979559/ref/XP_007906538.1/ PREDICTED: CST complex subunit CTC1 isoform X2 [Callorhinchus milii]
MEAFVAEFGEKLSRAEVQWLQNLYRFTDKNLLSISEVPDITCRELSRRIFQCLCRICHHSSNPSCHRDKTGFLLPLSYRFISIGELSQQKTQCCSCLAWSTSQFKEWTRCVEGIPADYKAVNRTNLLLCGILTDKICIPPSMSETATQQHDGHLYFKDKNDFLHCEVTKLDLSWLEHLVLFPRWSYIPQTKTVGKLDGLKTGYLEIPEAPFFLLPNLITSSPRVTGSLSALLPDSALHLLDKQFHSTEVKMNVAGELSRLSSMLHIQGETFFFFFLSSFTTDICLPIVVQVPSKLVWHHCLIPSERYVVTEMFVSSLQSTSNKLFVVSSSSDFHIYNEGFVKEQTLAEFMQASHIKEMSKQALKTTVKEEPSQISLCANWSTQNTIEILDNKESKVCSYQGVISRVLNISAGLYELDGKFGLCIAYQQMINCARGLRPGVRVEIHDAHLYHKKSEHFPSIMLCCCLRSILIVTEFSSLDAEYQPFTTNCNIYINLLFKYNLDLPNYLWLVHIVESLVQRFCPQLVTLRKMLLCSDSGVVDQFITSAMKYTGWKPLAMSAREIYQEILSESHPCPLKEISCPNISCQSTSISELLSNAEERGWKAVKMFSLLPSPEIKHLVAQQLNRKLAWSFEVLKPEDFQPQMILVGVLLANSVTGHLQLKDTSGSLDCVVQNFNKMEQSAFCETSLLDCLVQLEKYQLVVERFICSNFPSYKDLEDLSFVKEKQTRIYVQFCASDVQVLGTPIASATPNKRSPLIPTTATAASTVGGAAVSSYSQACKKADVTSTRANGNKNGPSLPKMPRLEEVALQEGHVGESRRTACSHPLQNVSETVDSQSEKNVPGVTVTSTGNWEPCRQKRKQKTCDAGCVTRLIFVTHKDALMLRNCQYGRTASCGHTDGSSETSSKRAGTEFELAFHVCAISIGRPRRWECEDEIQGIPELEVDVSLCSYRAQVQLIFMGKAVRWYHLISPEGLYRLIAPKELDTSVFEQNCSSDLLKALKSSNCSLSLVVQPGWDLQYVTSLCCLHDHQLSKNQIHLNANINRLDSVRPQTTSIQQVLGSSFSASLVSFTGIILLRSCNEPNWRSSFVVSSADRKKQGVSVPGDWNLKLTVGEVGNPSGTVDVYIDLMRLSYTLGILPGAVVAFCDLERCISRSNNVYCKFLPSSSLTVLVFPSSETQRSSSWPAKMPIGNLPHLYLGNVITRPGRGLQGITICHVVHVWWLSMQWVCSLCSSIFQQGRCTKSSGSCPSAVGVFRASGSVIVEDGTAEARVSCRDEQVAELLAVSSEEWEELQRHVNSRGKVNYQHHGRTGNELPEYGTGDILMQYLATLCHSTAVCRSIQLAFKLDLRNNLKAEQKETFQLKRFTCGEHQYITKMAPPLSLICLDVKEMDCQKFCDLASDKLMSI